MVHSLKTWPDYYADIVNGTKTAELRKDDRDFQIGDELLLEEYEPKLDIYTGKTCCVIVTGVLRNFTGLEAGYCVLSIKLNPDSNRYVVDRVGVHP